MSRVGVDLDGVIYDFTESLRVYLEAHGWTRAQMPEPVRWEFYEDWGLPLPDFITACGDGVDAGVIFRFGAPINDAQYQLQRLRTHGHSIHFITDRSFGTRSEENTGVWIEEYGLPYDSLTFTRDKTAVPVDYMIDDKPANITALLGAGVDAALQDRLHNRDFSTGWRVSSLREFVDLIIVQEEKAA